MTETDSNAPRLADAAMGMGATVTVPSNRMIGELVGPDDRNLRQIEAAFRHAEIVVRGNEVLIAGNEAAAVRGLFRELIAMLESGVALDREMIGRAIDMVKADERPSDLASAPVVLRPNGGAVRPKTAGQRRYLDAIASNIVTFGIGPAGTGKSWLAVAMAVQALQQHQVDRIVLTRPAVEAGERLGFLPGDLMAKVDPYLRPLYDALHDMVGMDAANKMVDRGVVEVAPLAFMRGRTLNRSFVILDEAQNTTPSQLKMFLTRLGFGSKAVVTGDRTQTDVTSGVGGLDDVESVLGRVPDLAIVLLTRRDVVRHKIVQDIVDAYDTHARTTKPRDSANQRFATEDATREQASGSRHVASTSPDGGM